MSTDPRETLQNHTVVLVDPGHGESFGFHSFFMRRLTGALMSYGVDVMLLDAAEPDFGPRFLKILARGNAIHFGTCLYDAHWTFRKSPARSLYDDFGALNFPVFFDHAFAEWLHPAVANLTPNNIAVCAIGDVENELRVMNPGLRHYEHLFFPCLSEDEAVRAAKPMAERELDFVISWSVSKTRASIHDLREKLRADLKLLKFGEALYDRFSEPFQDTPHIAHFKALVTKEFGIEPVFTPPWNEAQIRLLKILHYVDFITRTEIRAKFLDKLHTLPKHLKIGITAPGGPDLHPNAVYIGNHAQQDMQRIFGNARFTLNFNPTYKSVLQERTTYALSNGCIPIAYKDSFMRDHFVHGESIFYTRRIDGLDPEPFEKPNEELQAIADAGKAIVLENFSLDVYAARLAEMFARHVS